MRRPSRTVSYRDLALVALFGLGTIWFGYLTWGILGKEERARQDVTDTKATLSSLSDRQATLEANLAELDTERGKEAELRDTEGVALPGEEVIIVVPPVATSSATTTEPWWHKVLDWF